MWLCHTAFMADDPSDKPPREGIISRIIFILIMLVAVASLIPSRGHGTRQMFLYVFFLITLGAYGIIMIKKNKVYEETPAPDDPEQSRESNPLFVYIDRSRTPDEPDIDRRVSVASDSIQTVAHLVAWIHDNDYLPDDATGLWTLQQRNVKYAELWGDNEVRYLKPEFSAVPLGSHWVVRFSTRGA